VTAKPPKIGGALQRLGPLLIIFVMMPTLALGHSFPNHSDPRVGSEVKTPPTQVKIWFDAGIEPLFSSISVFDANKKQVDKGDSHIEGNDNTVFEVSVPLLPPGTYEVFWSVISVDTHHTEGRFKFKIEG